MSNPRRGNCSWIIFWKKRRRELWEKEKNYSLPYSPASWSLHAVQITVFAADGGKSMYQRCIHHSGHWYPQLWQLVLHWSRKKCIVPCLSELRSEESSGLISILKRQYCIYLKDGIVGVLTDSYNMGILVFLVILGIMVCMMNNAGGSAAFGRWASIHIKTRVGAQLATIVLGILDLYLMIIFNCLTVWKCYASDHR